MLAAADVVAVDITSQVILVQFRVLRIRTFVVLTVTSQDTLLKIAGHLSAS